MFTEAGIDVGTTTCIYRELWAKTVINSAINPLTALLGKPNGVILEDAGVNETARDLIAEGVAIARLHGQDLTEDEMVERTMSVALRTNRNVSSMYQDIRRKRRTEVDSINGAICAKAEEMGAKAPINRTMVRLIKALEEKNLE
jgi:2-dehydropantoate 2-reductase